MADVATEFDTWDPNTWESVHKMPKAFADPEDFSKAHTPNKDEGYFRLSADYTKQTKISMKRDIWEHDAMEIYSADGAVVFQTERKDEGVDKQILVKDHNGAVLGVCHRFGTWEAQGFKVSCPRSLYPGEIPGKDIKLMGYAPVYNWAGVGNDPSAPVDSNGFKLQFIVKNEAPAPKDNKDLISGLYRGHRAASTYYFNDDAKNFHDKTNAHVIRKQYPGQQDDPVIGIFAPSADEWQLLLAPGVDPVLMICFLAVTDEMKAEKKELTTEKKESTAEEKELVDEEKE